jgi:hypothetical protein
MPRENGCQKGKNGGKIAWYMAQFTRSGGV